MGDGHDEEFVSKREDLGAATAHLLPAIAVLASKLLRLPVRENDDTRRSAKLEKQLAAARDAVKAEKAANTAFVRERTARVVKPLALTPSAPPITSAERLLDVAIGALRARPPLGVEAAYIDGLLARNRGALLGIVRAAFRQ